MNLEFLDGYVTFRPSAHGSFPEAVSIIATSLSTATLLRVDRFMVDVTGLTGCPSPNLWQRFWMATEWADITRGLRLAIVAREELIDPDRFGIVVARNRALLANVFTAEAEAIAWLLEPKPKW